MSSCYKYLAFYGKGKNKTYFHLLCVLFKPLPLFFPSMTLYYISQLSAYESTGLAFSLPFARKLLFVPRSPSAPGEFRAGCRHLSHAHSKKTPSVVVLASPEMGLTKTFGECRGVSAHLLEGALWTEAIRMCELPVCLSCSLSVVPWMWWLWEKNKLLSPWSGYREWGCEDRILCVS